MSYFPAFCVAMGLPSPSAEYRFHASRKWRFDWAWPEHRVALEVQGGIWIRGGHSRGSGQTRDFEKYNTAASEGWRLLQITPDELHTVATVELIRKTLVGPIE
jgi:hypothetical protein